MAEDWPRVRALLEADVLYRAREQTDGGPARLFNALDPAIRWHGDTLSIRLVHHSAARRLDGRGVVLVPSAFAWPRVLVKTGPVRPVTVRYPTRGVGLLWTADRPATPDALAGVLGATRARLLTALNSPASTTELARRLRLSPGAVSQQLTALRAAGLVTARHIRVPVTERRPSRLPGCVSSGMDMSQITCAMGCVLALPVFQPRCVRPGVPVELTGDLWVAACGDRLMQQRRTAARADCRGRASPRGPGCR